MAETNKKTIPTKTQIEVLMSDWLGNLREKGTFIHKKTKGAIVQEIERGSHFSDYFIGDTNSMNQEDLLRTGREIAQNVVNGMTEDNIKVVLGDRSYTDGENICVASDYFDNPKLQVGEKIDILIGYSVHEASHVNFSDFGKLEKMIERLKNSPTEYQVKKTIANILEDERIEYRLGETMPGLSDYIGCCKKHSFGSFEKEKKEQNVSATEPIPKFLNTLLGAVRYPTMLTEEQIIDNFDELNQVRKILSPFPETTEGVFAATDKIYEVMKDIIKKDLEQKQEQKKNQGQKEGDNTQNSGQSSSNQQNQSGQNSQPNSNGQAGEKQEDSQSQTPSQKEIEQALEQALQSIDCKKLLQSMENNTKAPTNQNNNNASAISCSNPNITDYVNGNCEIEGYKAGGHSVVTYMKKVSGNTDTYNTALKKVKKYIPAMTKALRCRTIEKDYELQGETSGKLNTNKLVSLKCGNENIFIKRGNITCDSACICILIDESGSMNDKRKTAARETAILINEAVRHIPNLELFAYGYTDNEMNIYCERKNANKYALGSTRSSGGTPTGQAMAIAAQRVRKMTNSKCLMLVITDGMPDSREQTHYQDQRLRKMNFIPVGIWIAGGISNPETMMQDSVELTSLDELAPQIGKIVKKKLLKNLKIHDSM